MQKDLIIKWTGDGWHVYYDGCTRGDLSIFGRELLGTLTDFATNALNAYLEEVEANEDRALDAKFEDKD